jgi:hypothetical protein
MATTKRVRTTKSAGTAKSKTGSEVARVSTQAVDIQEAIRCRAYQLYEERGGQDGRDNEDWLRAENEVLERFGAQSA